VPVLVVDVANVMGSRPDGWWRDRAGAATRLMASLVPLVGRDLVAPSPGAPVEAGSPGSPASSVRIDRMIRIDRIVAVVEGKARTAVAPVELDVVAAPADGDSTIVAVANDVLAGDEVPLVVTADRGLRERLPSGSLAAGPGWLLALI
jgi:hypothetical protein